MHKYSVKKKTSQRDVTQKLRKEKTFFFLYATRSLDLIHIAVKFHQDIPYAYLVMECISIVWKKKPSQSEVTQKLGKEEQHVVPWHT